MVSGKDIAILRGLWKNEQTICCMKYAGCYINMAGDLVPQEPKSLLAQSETKIKEHAKRVKKMLVANAMQNTVMSVKFEELPFPGNETLDNILESRMEDEEALQELYEMIARAFPNKANPIEVLVYWCAYDMPQKAADGTVLEDSEYVFHHLVVLVLDTKMQRKELAMIKDQAEITEPNRIIKNPITGFVYPAFEKGEPEEGMIIYNADTLAPCHNLYSELKTEAFRTTDELRRELGELFRREFGENEVKDRYLQALMEAMGECNPYDTVNEQYFELLLDRAKIDMEDKVWFVDKYMGTIGDYKPFVWQLQIPEHTVDRAKEMRRERKKKLLMQAAAVIEELKGAESQLAKELREEANL